MRMFPARWRRHPILALGARQPGASGRNFFAIPRYRGAVVTPRRVLNLYRARWESLRLRETLRSYPITLTVEPSNACNLRCPRPYGGRDRGGEQGRESEKGRCDLHPIIPAAAFWLPSVGRISRYVS